MPFEHRLPSKRVDWIFHKLNCAIASLVPRFACMPSPDFSPGLLQASCLSPSRASLRLFKIVSDDFVGILGRITHGKKFTISDELSHYEAAGSTRRHGLGWYTMGTK